MTPDEKLEARNGTLMGLVVCVLVVCSLVGCDYRQAQKRDFAQVATKSDIAALTKAIGALKPTEPTPAPIDYRPNFESLSKQLSQLAERSVVKKPEPEKPNPTRKPCR